MTIPSPRQTIGMYLALSDIVVSSVLFTNGEGNPIFFICKKLLGVEERYGKHEKIVLALVHLVRRLKLYFQGRLVQVYTVKDLNKCLRVVWVGRTGKLPH